MVQGFVEERQHYPTSDGEREKILPLFPNPLYTGTRILFREDLQEMGLDRVLEGLCEEMRPVVLGHAKTLTSIKPELAFHFLMKVDALVHLLRREDLESWVRLVLDIYDVGGLNPARDFILQLDRHPEFARFQGNAVAFRDVAGILQHYLHALGEESIVLKEASVPYTDVESIFLPERVTLFGDRKRNFLLYKVMTTFQYGRIHLGTHVFRLDRSKGLVRTLQRLYRCPEDPVMASDLSRFLGLFPDPNLAGDLFSLADAVRVEAWMQDRFPGLHHRLKTLQRELASRLPLTAPMGPRAQAVASWVRRWLSGDERSGEWEGDDLGWGFLQDAARPRTSVERVAEITAALYGIVVTLSGAYGGIPAVPYWGELRPEEAEQGRTRRRESTRIAFRDQLAKLMGELPDGETVHVALSPTERRGVSQRGIPRPPDIPDQLMINDNPVPVPEAMQNLIKAIYEDLGSIPSSYLAVTDDMSGHFFRSLCRMPEGTGYFLSEQGEGIHAIDEWDYRRQGYRRRWALLRETDAPEGHLGFAEETLGRYAGMIKRIRRQFERIRLEDRVLKRQKEGDEIDLDAAVEALCDYRAGQHPSERVFARLSRDQRDIAAAFLIDLSGSTKGWINEMERAALLILSEALEVLKDRFAIYGFSGQTRKRCELFRIKGFDEAYGDVIKRRIADLQPREYTRLGPPTRHVAGKLNAVQSRTKLLITLSDGKPDDYDGYNGAYGIEDTRHALVEAKNMGIHPFCITIDKAEHSYLSHMYGAVNYVFIDDLSQLPLKVPEIYRKLTT